MTSLSRLGPLGAFRELRHEFDRAVLVLAVGDLVASFGFSLVFPFLTIYLTSQLGASATQSGLVLGLYSIASIGSNAAGGWLADRIGRKRVMIGSITLTSLTVAAMGQVHDLTGVAVLTLALGVVDPAFVPAARAAIADVVPEDGRQRAYSLLGVAASVGWIAGPAIGAGLASLGYPLLFTVSGAILLVYTGLLVVALPETRPDIVERGLPDPTAAIEPEIVHGAVLATGGQVHHHAPHVAEPGAEATVHTAPAPTVPAAPAAPAAQAPAVPAPAAAPPVAAEPSMAPSDARALFLGFLPIAVVIHAVTFEWVAILPIYASRSLGISNTTWGLLFALNGLLIVLFQLRISTSTERWPKPRTMAVGLASYALGYLAVLAAGLPGAATIVLGLVVALATIGEMLVFPVEPAFVADLSPLQLRGRYQGMFGAAAGLGSAVGPPLGGLALDTLPTEAAWLSIAGAGAVAVAALLWLSQRTRTVAEAST